MLRMCANSANCVECNGMMLKIFYSIIETVHCAVMILKLCRLFMDLRLKQVLIVQRI